MGTSELTWKTFGEIMLNRFGVNSSSYTAAAPGVELGPRDEGEQKGDYAYKDIVGNLMWLSTITRPDILIAVRAVARHSHDPPDIRPRNNRVWD